MSPHVEVIFEAITAELESALRKHPRYHSAHEAYAVIAEELEEFWELVRKRHHDHAAMSRELVQVAVTAIRAIADVTLTRCEAHEVRVLLGLPMPPMPPCPACKSNARVTISPRDIQRRGFFFCPCNEAGSPGVSGHFNAVQP